jgi:hypothetical protein
MPNVVHALVAAARIAATFGLGVPLAAQQTTLNVTVLDGTGGGPVDQAQVQVAGTNLGGLTNGEGRVVLRGVPAGSQVIRVLRVGYAEGKQTVVVAAGQSTDVTIPDDGRGIAGRW